MIRKLLFGAAAISTNALSAYGQDVLAESGATTSPTNKSRSALEEVIVTAQKRDENILEVPISVTVVSSDQLDRTGGQSLNSISDRVPSLFISNGGSYGASPIGIRGSTGVSTSLGDEPVAVYVDGIYQARGGFLGNAGMLDVGTIEIVRGPQGTLQGRNATAGAVLVNSSRPTDELSGFVKTRFSDPQGARFEGALSGPLSTALNGRIAFAYTDEEGWADNRHDGSKLAGLTDTKARLSLEYAGDSPLSALFIANYQDNEAEGAVARWAATCFNPDTSQALVLNPCATPTVPLAPEEREDIYDGKFNLNHTAIAVAESWGANLNVSYEFGDVELVSLTGYSEYSLSGSSDSDGFGTIFPGDTREGFNESVRDSDQFSQELRLQSDVNNTFSWILGAYYFLEDQFMDFAIVNNGVTPAASSPTNPTRTRTQFLSTLETTSYAVFADATWRFADKFAAIGGVRYSNDEKDFSRTLNIFNSLSGNLIVSPPYVLPTKDSWDDVSYRAKLTYEPNDDTLIYASYSTGFKGGGFNAFGGAANAPSFEPEILQSFEIGAKLSLPSVRGYVSAAVYTNDYENLQIRAGVPSGGVAIFNAADSRIDGFEIETSFVPLQGLTLSGNVAYTDARYTSFPTARDLDENSVDASGNRLSRAPEWQYFVSGLYEHSLSVDWLANLELTYSWRDTIYHLHTNQDSFPWQGRPLENLGTRLTLIHDPSRIEFGVYGTNLTDDRSVTNAGNTFSYPLAAFNPPRTLGIFLNKEF